MDDNATDTAISASSSSCTSHSTATAHPARILASPVRSTGSGYWWRKEESELYERLVDGYGEDAVDWHEVARELARQCPMHPAPARTAKQCSARRGYLREWSCFCIYLSKYLTPPIRFIERCANRSTDWSEMSAARSWTTTRWEQLEAVVSEATTRYGVERLSTEQWKELGKTLEPKRTAASCAKRWRKGAPKGAQKKQAGLQHDKNLEGEHSLCLRPRTPHADGVQYPASALSDSNNSAPSPFQNPSTALLPLQQIQPALHPSNSPPPSTDPSRPRTTSRCSSSTPSRDLHTRPSRARWILRDTKGK